MLRSQNTSGQIVLVSKDIAYAFPFGIAYLAGYLRQKGEDVRVLFRPDNPAHYRDFVRRVVALKPLLVGFGSLYPDLYEVRELVRILCEERRSFPVVIGGQMVSPTPEFAVEITGADYGAIGEGEIIFYELVNALREHRDPSDVKGLAIRDGKLVKLTGPGEFIDDLSKLPPVPYDMFPAEKWLPIGRYYVGMAQPHWRYNDRVISIHGGRGCPYKCNFCYHHSKDRYRSISEMVAEADELLHRYDANMLYFGDDLVLSGPRRAQELTESLAKLKRPIEYSVSCRFDILSRIDDNVLREMKRTGCRTMGLGVESGSQRILDIMHKGTTVDQIVTGLRRLKDVGILPTVSIMVGQLSETVEDVKQSMALMIETVRYDKNIQYAFTITTPFPGTELYYIALQKGILKDHHDFYERFDPKIQMFEVSVNLSNMSDTEVEAVRTKLDMTFRQEKEKAIGRNVLMVESSRRRLARIDRGFRKKVISRLPDARMVMVLPQLYGWLYNRTQILLDKWRLQLLGIPTVRRQ